MKPLIVGAFVPRWDEIALIAGLTGQQVLECAICAPGRGHGQVTVDELTAYLDYRKYPGILQALARASLETARSFLEEVLPLNDETESMLVNPYKYFYGETGQEMRERISEHFISKVNRGSPEHSKRTMIAFIEYGLENYRHTVVNVGYAHNEKAVENFGEELENRTDKAMDAIMVSERMVADLLAVLIHDFRNNA